MSFIIDGLQAISTAFKVNEQIIDSLAGPDKNIDELLRRTREVNGLLIAAQTALHSAAEENRQLKETLSDRSHIQQLRDDMDFCQDGGFYVKKSERAAGNTVQYCSTCWGEEKAVPLMRGATSGSFICGKDGSHYFTQEYHDRKKKELDEMARRSSRNRGGPEI
jgi:hypothetical protein